MGYNINEKNPKKYQLEQTLEKGSKLACLKVKQGKNTLNWLWGSRSEFRKVFLSLSINHSLWTIK